MLENDAIQGFSALGNGTRLAVFRLLVRAGQDGLATGRIGSELDVPLSTLAHHLDALARARLISQVKSGREVICIANYATLLALTTYLNEKCCEGVPEDCLSAELEVAD